MLPHYFCYFPSVPLFALVSFRILSYRYTGYSQDTMYALVSISPTSLSNQATSECSGFIHLLELIKFICIVLQNYYNIYGGQQFSPYYGTGSSGSPGMFHNFYPFYAQYAQSSQAQGFGVHYPQMLQYGPFLPHHYGTAGILSLPTSMPATTSSTGHTSIISTHL